MTTDRGRLEQGFVFSFCLEHLRGQELWVGKLVSGPSRQKKWFSPRWMPARSGKGNYWRSRADLWIAQGRNYPWWLRVWDEKYHQNRFPPEARIAMSHQTVLGGTWARTLIPWQVVSDTERPSGTCRKCCCHVLKESWGKLICPRNWKGSTYQSREYFELGRWVFGDFYHSLIL